jgi:hypothetical protein
MSQKKLLHWTLNSIWWWWWLIPKLTTTTRLISYVPWRVLYMLNINKSIYSIIDIFVYNCHFPQQLHSTLSFLFTFISLYLLHMYIYFSLWKWKSIDWKKTMLSLSWQKTQNKHCNWAATSFISSSSSSSTTSELSFLYIIFFPWVNFMYICWQEGGWEREREKEN